MRDALIIGTTIIVAVSLGRALGLPDYVPGLLGALTGFLFYVLLQVK